MSIDEDGNSVLINFQKRVFLSALGFKNKVSCVKFSPDGRFFVVAMGKSLQIWKTPPSRKVYAPFELLKEYGGHTDKINYIDWSPDSEFFCTCSNDLSVRIYKPFSTGYRAPSLMGHRDKIVRCFFDSVHFLNLNN